MKRSTREICKKINKYCDEVILFNKGMTYESFINDIKTLRATTLCFIQIGELVYNMDNDFKELHKNIDWNGLAGLRHRLVHDYEGINHMMIWDMVTNEADKLKCDITKLLTNEDMKA